MLSLQTSNIKDQTSTLVWSWFKGSKNNNAFTDVFLRRVSPFGSLPWILRKKLEDSSVNSINSFPSDRTLAHNDSIFCWISMV